MNIEKKFIYSTRSPKKKKKKKGHSNDFSYEPVGVNLQIFI